MLDESGRLQRQLQRLTQGTLAPLIVDVPPSVSPVMIVGPDGGAFSGGAPRYGGSLEVAAGVGVTGILGIMNPKDSGFTMVVEQLSIAQSTAGGITKFGWAISQGFPTAVQSTVPPTNSVGLMDTREGLSNLKITVQDGTINGPVIATAVRSFGSGNFLVLPGQNMVPVPFRDWVLTPDSILVVSALANNTTYSVAWQIRVTTGTVN